MKTSTVESELFHEYVENSPLTQHVMIPTRGNALLDLILTSEPELINDIEVSDFLGGSDHRMLSWSINLSHGESKHSTKLVYDYLKTDRESVAREIRSIIWVNLLIGNIEAAWSSFKLFISDIEKKYVLLKKQLFNGRKKPVWLSYKAIKKVRKRHKIFANIKIPVILHVLRYQMKPRVKYGMQN